MSEQEQQISDHVEQSVPENIPDVAEENSVESSTADGGESSSDAQSGDLSVEQRATLHGWDPNKYSKDSKKYKTAEEFLKYGEEVPALNKDRLRKFEKEVFELRQENQKRDEVLKKIVEANKKMRDMSIQQELNRIKAEQLKAVEEADPIKHQALEKERDEIQQKQIQEEVDFRQTANTSNATPAEFNRWVSENRWYAEDEFLRQRADERGEKLHKQYPNIPPRDLFRIVEEDIKRDFSSRFTNTQKQRPSGVEVTTQRGAGKPTGGSMYQQLPADAKKVCEDMIRDGFYESMKMSAQDARKAYAEAYFNS